MASKYDYVKSLRPDLSQIDEEIMELREKQDELRQKYCDKCGKKLFGAQTDKVEFSDMEDDEFITMTGITQKELGELSHTCGYCLKTQTSLECHFGNEHNSCRKKLCSCKCHDNTP